MRHSIAVYAYAVTIMFLLLCWQPLPATAGGHLRPPVRFVYHFKQGTITPAPSKGRVLVDDQVTLVVLANPYFYQIEVVYTPENISLTVPPLVISHLQPAAPKGGVPQATGFDPATFSRTAGVAAEIVAFEDAAIKFGEIETALYKIDALAKGLEEIVKKTTTLLRCKS